MLCLLLLLLLFLKGQPSSISRVLSLRRLVSSCTTSKNRVTPEGCRKRGLECGSCTDKEFYRHPRRAKLSISLRWTDLYGIISYCTISFCAPLHFIVLPNNRKKLVEIRREGTNQTAPHVIAWINTICSLAVSFMARLELTGRPITLTYSAGKCY